MPDMTVIDNDPPLISFCLVAYNQELYIRDAVEAALAQTYSPLEIILSDDCSTDGTFAIMQACARKSQGRHQIKLNKNASNLGLCEHLNHVINLASGSIIVVAAGDDISIPKRVKVLADKFASEKELYSVHSSWVCINNQGEHLGIERRNQKGLPKDPLHYVAATGCTHVGGCSHAFRKDVFTVFGALDKRIMSEDSAIPFRSLLLGKIGYIDSPLLYYRWHAQNTCAYKAKSCEEYMAITKRWKLNELAVREQYQSDLRRARQLQLVSEATYSQLNHILNQEIERARFIFALRGGNNLTRLRSAIANPRLMLDWRNCVKVLVRLLPPAVYWRLVKLNQELSRSQRRTA
jgi:glycosyltransferase involved in cell wall biosynthesis